MHIFRCLVVLPLSWLLLTFPASATQAGWRQISMPSPASDTGPIQVGLYYPTQADARAIAMGPFTAHVAPQAVPAASFKGLIILSHGTGANAVLHSSLAEALAQHGYLVAALRHPGDNWEDRSLLQKGAARYFTDRPQQVSRVIDTLLGDREWGDRIARDRHGPRIGALGHSAGGYTVLALAGGEPDVSRIPAHCETHRADDPIFCSMGRTGQPTTGSIAPSPPIPPLTDRRVRAVVAFAPVGVVFTAQSLAKIRIPTAIYQADKDRFLVPAFHAEWVASNLPGAEVHRVANAWHFAFVDAPNSPIPSEDGDVGDNPPGFDRQKFLQQLRVDLPLFFDKAFNGS